MNEDSKTHELSKPPDVQESVGGIVWTPAPGLAVHLSDEDLRYVAELFILLDRIDRRVNGAADSQAKGVA